MNRWGATPPYEWSGAWEGRLQIACGYGTKTDICGHLHGSSTEAERCAQELVSWIFDPPQKSPERFEDFVRRFRPDERPGVFVPCVHPGEDILFELPD